MIYFLQPIDGGPVKIGFTDNLDTRRAQLEAHYGKPLALLATRPGGRETEREIHERFASLRFGRTEQFRPASELMAFIGRPLLVDPNPDAVEALPGRENVLIALKCRKEYKLWVESLAKKHRTTPSQLIDMALVKFAEMSGFDLPPER